MRTFYFLSRPHIISENNQFIPLFLSNEEERKKKKIFAWVRDEQIIEVLDKRAQR